MVSTWFFVRAVVLLVPFASGHGTKLPLLMDATAEELALGLERGDFTSMDLVKVRDISCARKEGVEEVNSLKPLRPTPHASSK
jgi:hypothetical protein